MKQEIGGRLRKLRMDRNLSMRVAFRVRSDYGIKIDPSYLSRIERGKVEIPLRTLFALADFYDVSPGWLIDPEVNRAVAVQVDGDGESIGVSVPPGTEYVLANANLLQDLKTLGTKFGEDTARKYLQDFLSHILSLIRDSGLKNAGENIAPADSDSTDVAS